ncbi:MAG: ABC transporter permease [Gracilibacteraceae bacterium]|jgi:ABC-type dipeptide/oligopeptide/nickel transport system permease component|nr:ABC transporter permease [Gracilibacteraceae bacterium]
MLGIVLKRLAQGLLVTFCVVFISFAVLRSIPGDPAKIMAPNATVEQQQHIREEMGLSEPVLVQFQMYVGNMLHGNMGNSYFKGDTVVNILLAAAPLSAILVAFALIFSIFVSLVLGTVAGMNGNSAIDRIISSFAVLLQSMPNYWVGAMLIMLLSVKAGIFPSMDYSGPSSCVLPIIALALPLTSVLIKVVRSSLIDSYNQEFVKAAYARGLSGTALYFKYALRNSLIPLCISISSQLGFLVGNIVVVEYVFNFPGLGYIALNAILRRDYNLVQAVIILFSVFFFLINIVVDLGTVRLDPRLRKAEGEI